MASLPELVADYIECGCAVAKMGKAVVPEGYAILLNSDRTHYFWLNSEGKEGPIHWNKWAVLKMVKKREGKR